MRIVHTSDWHAGRVWKGIHRLSEVGDVLEHLGDFLEAERVDLLLMSGDVFDSGAPNAEAEKLVFGFFKRVGRAGTQTVVIAGNHDSPARFQAWGTLTELVDVHSVGVPRRAGEGGVIEVTARSGEQAKIAAVPFAPVNRMVSALELAQDEAGSKQKYDEMMRLLVHQLCQGFTADTINLLMAHTHLQGARFSGSERQVHLGEQWATTSQAFPPTAHYVALGHIHKPQSVDAALSPTRYAGSLLQLDFGEEGESKSFVVVEAEPRRPVRIETVDYEGGIELKTIKAGLRQLEADAEDLSRAGWLRVKVPLTQPDPDVNGKVRRLLPNAVAVDVELPGRPADEETDRPPHGASPGELYRAYLLHHDRDETEVNLVETFERLYMNFDHE